MPNDNTDAAMYPPLPPEEHFVGVNGNNQLDAIRLWNSEAGKIAAGDFESAALSR